MLEEESICDKRECRGQKPRYTGMERENFFVSVSLVRSLKLWDTLPRLCDAAMSSECPELQLMRSWRSMLTEERGQRSMEI